MKVWIYPKHNILLLAMLQWEGLEACLGFIRVSVELELEASNNSLFPIPLLGLEVRFTILGLNTNFESGLEL
jgi:hypothetical protein